MTDISVPPFNVLGMAWFTNQKESPVNVCMF